MSCLMQVSAQMFLASEHQEVLSLLPHSLRQRTAKEGSRSPRMHRKTFLGKWPKQMAFHSGTKSSSSWRSPPFLSTSWPIGQEGRARRTGNPASPKGTPCCTTAAFPCGCRSLCRGVHIAGKMLWWCFLPYPLLPESFQLFSYMSERPQAGSASHLLIAQKWHFCAISLQVAPARAMVA